MHYDMEDLLEQANEIQETLGRSYAVPDEIDEADLEAGVLGYFSKHSLYISAYTQLNLELDALALEEEEEGPSYLADLNKVPDFVDEAPVELGEVRTSTISSFLHCQTDPFILFIADTRAAGGCQIDGLDAHEYIVKRSLYVWYIVLLVSNLGITRGIIPLQEMPDINSRWSTISPRFIRVCKPVVVLSGLLNCGNIDNSRLALGVCSANFNFSYFFNHAR